MTIASHYESIQVRLLGGFRVERDGGRPACAWPRRSAKTLTKLLAAWPSHALHREQIVETLWPGADFDSALNSFGKALHAARHALEPELPPRGCSHYLRLRDGLLSLDTEHVVIDVDRFERLAEAALRRRGAEMYEEALAAYAGELLPEDRYADWCAERRASLSELRLRLLLGLADVLEGHDARDEAAARLREVVVEDPTREEAHRRLIRIWAETGNRDQAVRQFHLCRQALRRHLDLEPQPQTEALYQDVLAGRVPTRFVRSERIEMDSHRPDPPAPSRATPSTATPLVGRQQVLDRLVALLERGGERPPMVLLTGEAGVGKTRLLEALGREVVGAATVLRGEVGPHVSRLPCGPVAVALEAFVASCPESQRRVLAQRYPALARLVPSLAVDPLEQAHANAVVGDVDLLLAAVRALTDLAGKGPLLLVVDDLHEADTPSLEVLRYFAHLARQRSWLVVAAIREEELQVPSTVSRAVESMLREGVCEKLELACLDRADAHELVRALCTDASITDDVAAEICARTSGHPLFIEALFEDVERRSEPRRAHGCLSLPPQPGSVMPPRIRFLVATQLRMLDDCARRILALAATAGTDEVSLEALLGAAGVLESPIAPTAVFDALDQALSSRILEERESGYAFRHPLVGSVLCQELSRHRREELRAAWCRAQGSRSRRLRLTASR